MTSPYLGHTLVKANADLDSIWNSIALARQGTFNVAAYGAESGGSTNNDVALLATNAAAVAAGGGRIIVPPGAWKHEGTFPIGSATVGVTLELLPGATLTYQPTAGTDPAIKLFGRSGVQSHQYAGWVRVGRDGCSAISADISNPMPFARGLQIYDDAPSRTSGSAIDFNSGAFINCDVDVKVDGGPQAFYDAVVVYGAFISRVYANVAGAGRDAFVFDGSSTSVDLSKSYANAPKRHGFRCTGHQDYFNFLRTSCDNPGGDAILLDKDGGGNSCQSFLFAAPSSECTTQSAHGHIIRCVEGLGHVFLAPYVLDNYNGSSAGPDGMTPADFIRLEGTTDVLIAGGWCNGPRGYAVNAIQSADGQNPARIFLVPPPSPVSVGLGAVNDPTGAIVQNANTFSSLITSASGSGTTMLVERHRNSGAFAANTRLRLAFYQASNFASDNDPSAYIDQLAEDVAQGGLVFGTHPFGDAMMIRHDGTIRYLYPLVPTGGGASATLGTIGGSGPTAAAQSEWKQEVDDTGATYWVPIWK